MQLLHSYYALFTVTCLAVLPSSSGGKSTSSCLRPSSRSNSAIRNSAALGAGRKTGCDLLPGGRASASLQPSPTFRPKLVAPLLKQLPLNPQLFGQAKDACGI